MPPTPMPSGPHSRSTLDLGSGSSRVGNVNWVPTLSDEKSLMGSGESTMMMSEGGMLSNSSRVWNSVWSKEWWLGLIRKHLQLVARSCISTQNISPGSGPVSCRRWHRLWRLNFIVSTTTYWNSFSSRLGVTLIESLSRSSSVMNASMDWKMVSVSWSPSMYVLMLQNSVRISLSSRSYAARRFRTLRRLSSCRIPSRSSTSWSVSPSAVSGRMGFRSDPSGAS